MRTLTLIIPAALALLISSIPATAYAQSPRGWQRGRGAGVVQGEPLPGRRVGQTRNAEPASARGYADGYQEGMRDARDRDRYDPVASRDYRNGDQGYYREYGSRDAYKNNYREGFRQGYDAGYREGRR